MDDPFSPPPLLPDAASSDVLDKRIPHPSAIPDPEDVFAGQPPVPDGPVPGGYMLRGRFITEFKGSNRAPHALPELWKDSSKKQRREAKA